MAFKIRVHPSTIAQRSKWNISGPLDYGYADHLDIMAYINDLRALHGDAPVSKLPRNFGCTLWVPLTDGRRVVLTVSEGSPPRQGYWGRTISSSKHRCHVTCPDCAVTVPAGRTHQHKCRKG